MPRIDIHSNKEEVLREVKIDGNSLYQANVKFKDDIDIVTKAVMQTPTAIILASERLRTIAGDNDNATQLQNLKEHRAREQAMEIRKRLIEKMPSGRKHSVKM